MARLRIDEHINEINSRIDELFSDLPIEERKKKYCNKQELSKMLYPDKPMDKIKTVYMANKHITVVNLGIFNRLKSYLWEKYGHTITLDNFIEL